MSRTLIYIDDQLCDVLPDTVVATTFQAFEIGDITRRNTSHTNRFKLPKTANNRRILGFVDNVASNSTAPYTLLNGKLVQGGLEIMRNANVQVISSEEYFEVEFFSGEKTFFDTIKDKNVNQLFQHPLPQLTDWPLSNSAMEQVFFNDGSLDETDNPLAFCGRWAIPYLTVIDRIISESGYTKSGEIFNNTLLNALSIMIPLFNNEYNDNFKPPREFKALRDTSSVFNATSSDLKIAFTEVEYNGGLYDGISTYEVDDPLFGGAYFYCNAYAVIVIDSISFDDGADRLRVQLFSGSGTYTIPDITAPGTYFLELSDNIGDDPISSPVTKVSGVDGQQIYVQARTTDNVGTPAGSAVVTFGEGTSFRVECLKENPLPSTYVNVGGAMPDLPQLDLMRDFAVRFGVLFRVGTGVVNSSIPSSASWTNLGISVTNEWGLSGIPLLQRVTMGAFQGSDYLGYIITNAYIGTYSFTISASGSVAGGAGNSAQLTFHFLDDGLNIIDSSDPINIPNDGLTDYEFDFEITSELPALIAVSANNLTGSSNQVSVSIIYESITINTGKRVECKTITEIITDRSNAADWTDKRDTSRKEKIAYQFRRYGRSNLLRYNANDDLTNEETGQGDLTIANVNLTEQQTLFDSPFASSHTRNHGNANTGFITCAEIPIVEDGEDENEPGIRLLMVRNKRSFEPTLSGGNSTYKVGYFEDIDDLEGKDATFQYAVDTQYSGFSACLQQMKTVTRYYNLTPVDIAQIDLFRLVYDDGAYFMIEKIENYVPGVPTKVTLFKVS